MCMQLVRGNKLRGGERGGSVGVIRRRRGEREEGRREEEGEGEGGLLDASRQLCASQGFIKPHWDHTHTHTQYLNTHIHTDPIPQHTHIMGSMENTQTPQNENRTILRRSGQMGLQDWPNHL